MKKKKLPWSLLATFVAMLCVGLTACGGDDEEEDKGGGNQAKGFSLVGKTFYKKTTEYSDIGEKTVNNENVYFKTERICIVSRWGSWELIYSDGTKDTNKYNTGEMTCTYTVAGNTVTVKSNESEVGEWYYTIVDGGLEGFKMTSDDNNKEDDNGYNNNEDDPSLPAGEAGTSDMFGYYTNTNGLRAMVQRNAESAVNMGMVDPKLWKSYEIRGVPALHIVDGHTINTVSEYCTLTKPTGSDIVYAIDTYTVKGVSSTYTYTYYFCLEEITSLWKGRYSMNGTTMNIVTSDNEKLAFTYSGGNILWENSTFAKVK